MKNKDNLIWIDLEMTGLYPEKDRILEIATIVTDPHLHILGQGPVLAISQSEACLAAMDNWNTTQHNRSGLVARVLASQVTESEAEQATIAFLERYVEKGMSPMCGNSICQDRRFLYKYMPALADFFHYRNLDVSTVKELVKRWKPELIPGVMKESKHQALEDIQDSIEELMYYRKHFMKDCEGK
jgi:oligoribonuclease